MALERGFNMGIEIAGQDRLLTIHKVSLIQLLPVRYLNTIRSTPGVAHATHSTWFGGIYQDERNFFAQMAVVPEDYLDIYPEYVRPDDQRQRWIDTRTGAIAGRKLAERFGWQVGDRIPIEPTIWRPRDGGNEAYEFELVGIYEGRTQDVDETAFFFHHRYLMERMGDIGEVGWFTVQVEDPATADQVALAIDQHFANSPAETKTTSEEAFMRSFAEQVGNTKAILMAIALIVFFVILLIVANTMAQSVRERTQELGVLKTLGFTDRGVLLLVLAEGVLLSVGAALLGLFLVVLAAPGLAKQLQMFLPVFYIPRGALVAGLGIAVALGLASGGVPAWLAMRMNIVDALQRR